MKNIKKFDEFLNEGIKKVINYPELITDILNFIGKKDEKELSRSEKMFIEDAKNKTITKINIPEDEDQNWNDPSNEHNIGICWQSNNKWNQLIPKDEN